MWNCPLNCAKENCMLETLRTQEAIWVVSHSEGGRVGLIKRFWSKGKKRSKLHSVSKHCGESLWWPVLKQMPTAISLGLLFSNQGPNTAHSGTTSNFTNTVLCVDVDLLDWELYGHVGCGQWPFSLSVCIQTGRMADQYEEKLQKQYHTY